ncbi:MAG: phet bact: phenylalanine--trna ligase beta subunit, partial [Verrucomicrobiaceae bacterium]|nr:phet bact: phenylalanine--trna ligase beta subunit [Verrucomicrobiaceae bacterium]
MKVSLSWLSTHIDLSNYTTPQLTDLLTFAGVEVEGVEEKGVSSDKVVVGQIKEFSQHPNADRLSVCLVDDGSGPLRQIVCGAKNFKAGDKVPVALPGAVLPGNFEIKEGKLRGVVSNGMLCSGKELGIGEDTGGLLILDADAPVGRPFKELVPADVLFDLEVTPNRPDLLSHLGLARELAALTGLPLIGQREYSSFPVPTAATNVKIEASEACPFYGARLIKGVKVGSSPAWLRARLESIGLRPINSVVDITNFVLMEMGQPLHAFDLAKLNSGNIIVRMAAEGEKMLALNGTEYPLAPEDLLITDGTRAVAIAGVMGGEDSGVTEATTNILLEAAYFQPSGIRRTSRKLILGSDSSYRYERGVDPQQTLGASELATKLILEIAGGTAEASTAAGTAPKIAGEVTFNEAKTRSLLGIPDLKAEEMHSILTKLGLAKLSASGEISQWQVPSYRLDLQRSVDLAEEIARVVGLDRVPSKKQAAFAISDVADKNYDFAMQVRQALANRGFFEAQTLRLISTTQLSDSLGLPDV